MLPFASTVCCLSLLVVLPCCHLPYTRYCVAPLRLRWDAGLPHSPARWERTATPFHAARLARFAAKPSARRYGHIRTKPDICHVTIFGCLCVCLKGCSATLQRSTPRLAGPARLARLRGPRVYSVEKRSCRGSRQGVITANLCTKIMDFRGFDSIIILSLRVGTFMTKGNFLECLSRAILVGIILVGGLGASCCPEPQTRTHDARS